MSPCISLWACRWNVPSPCPFIELEICVYLRYICLIIKKYASFLCPLPTNIHLLNSTHRLHFLLSFLLRPIISRTTETTPCGSQRLAPFAMNIVCNLVSLPSRHDQLAWVVLRIFHSSLPYHSPTRYYGIYLYSSSMINFSWWKETMLLVILSFSSTSTWFISWSNKVEDFTFR